MLGDKFRLRFEKAGVLRLLSHHDLMRVLERMLRRAGLPFKSTAGFHPGPRVVFAQSLPLNVVGRDEVVELELTEVRDSDDVVTGLNTQAPEGLRFTRATVVPMRTTAMPRRIVYALPLPADRVDETATACAELLAAEAVWVERVRPSPKGLNIRRYLRRVQVLPATPQPSRLPSVSTDSAAGGPPPHPACFAATLSPEGRGCDASEPAPTPAELEASAPAGCLPPSPLGGEGRGEARGVRGRTTSDEAESHEHAPTPLWHVYDKVERLSDGRVIRSSCVARPKPVLILDLWVTTTGTARADELLRLLGVDDLLDAGCVLERTLVELRDEAAAPLDPTDIPPDGPADTRPADPTRATPDQPAAAGVAVPGDLATE